MAKQIMLDCATLSNIKGGGVDSDLLADLSDEFYICEVQYDEIYEGTENYPSVVKEIDAVVGVLEVEELEAETLGYGDAYGRCYGGKKGDFYDELQTHHAEPDSKARPDVRGAETALAREMTFVTADENLKDAIRAVDPEKLMSEEEFRAYVGAS